MTRQRWVCAAALAFATLWHARGARAADDELWKDGCPGKYAPENLPKDLPDLPTHEGASSFGAPPDADDTLGPSRLSLVSVSSSLTQQHDRDGKPPNLWGEQLLFQYNTGSRGPMAMVSWAWGYAYSIDPNVMGFHDLANFQAYVGYRSTSYLLRPAFRRGWAVRIGGGAAFDGNDPGLVAERQRLAVIAPFRTELYGFDRPLGVSAEYRIEMIGCHGPFLHGRIDALTWNTQVGIDAHPRVFVIPASIAGGGFIYPRFALYGQFGIEFRSPKSETIAGQSIPVMVYGHVARTSLGVEWQFRDHHFHLGFRGSALTGDNARGLEMAMTLSSDHMWEGAQ